MSIIKIELTYRSKETGKYIDTVHTKIDNDELTAMVNEKFQNGAFPCRIHLNREEIELEAEISSVEL